MDAHLPDDLRGLERRLADWQPDEAALDADRMLFAAGRASAQPRQSRLAWPAMAGCLAVLASVLGLGLARERAERLALARQLEQRQPDAGPAPHPSPPARDDETSGPPSPDSYLAARAALERGDPDAWRAPAGNEPPSPAPPPPILRAWGPGTLIDP
jgi:hypothetical protein